MSIFEEVTLVWGGRDYKIPPDRIMKGIALVEDVITIVQLTRYQQRADMPLVKLSQAYGVLMRYAGAKVTDEEIYRDMFVGEGDIKQRALDAVHLLMSMMVPPSCMLRQEEQLVEGKSAEATTKDQ